MTVSSDPRLVPRFRSVILRRLGLHFPEDQSSFLGDVLERRLDRLGAVAETYLDTIDDQQAISGEWDELIEKLTVGETCFFRSSDQLDAWCEHALPMLMRHSGRTRVRILCAGCASGEEPYTLAMLLRQRLELAGMGAEILAIDLNRAALARARAGSYSAWSLRETPAPMRERFFRPEGRGYVLDEEIRAAVSFVPNNLAQEDAAFWSPERFDVIFCRNVIMYLGADVCSSVIDRFARSLARDGYLFLGYAETLRGVSTAFRICHTHHTFYYQRADAPLTPGCSASSSDHRAAANTCREPGPGGGTDPHGWIGEIGRSTTRIAALAASAGGQALTAAPAIMAPPAIPSSPPSAAENALAENIIPELLALLARERFAETVARVRTCPLPSRSHPLLRLLEAVALVQGGEVASAQTISRAMLAHAAGPGHEAVPEQAPWQARAHYLIALCHEQSGDTSAACEHYRCAAAFDAHFAMPCLRLGLIAQRLQEADAGQAFAQALGRIDSEDELHLQLFGGGFTRAAIADLCRRHASGAVSC